uniref:Uncharacterized protein n=1 Tax=Aplanochytrium stocchinoi TaxID=215587 RepID=A0A7S3V1N1_9STRA|mmetsp:Transcript_18902/g.23054  ORF Transcript_18902/g.23054 Transcript_18902/m.23054 type:complete len:168 (+) Transcript_18902:127-630(+)
MGTPGRDITNEKRSRTARQKGKENSLCSGRVTRSKTRKSVEKQKGKINTSSFCAGTQTKENVNVGDKTKEQERKQKDVDVEIHSEAPTIGKENNGTASTRASDDSQKTRKCSAAKSNSFLFRKRSRKTKFNLSDEQEKQLQRMRNHFEQVDDFQLKVRTKWNKRSEY